MKIIQGTWPLSDWRLNPDEIHVWAVFLDMTASTLNSFTGMMSVSEKERVRSFRLDLHRNRFIVGRGCLRVILSRYLMTGPEKVVFAHGPHGKPFLSDVFADSGLNFNLAHSENIGLLAVTRAGPIGIDIERIRPLTEAEQIVERFFSARESAAFQKLGGDQQPAAFFKLWTRKEAWLKATGEGIGHLLREVQVSFLPGEAAQFFSLPASSQPNAPWILQDLKFAPGFAAALAVSARVMPSRCSYFAEEATNKALAQSLQK